MAQAQDSFDMSSDENIFMPGSIAERPQKMTTEEYALLVKGKLQNKESVELFSKLWEERKVLLTSRYADDESKGFIIELANSCIDETMSSNRDSAIVYIFGFSVFAIILYAVAGTT